jgi:hypothetical protein
VTVNKNELLASDMVWFISLMGDLEHEGKIQLLEATIPTEKFYMKTDASVHVYRIM